MRELGKVDIASLPIEGAKNIHEPKARRSYKVLLRMLLTDRVDYVLGYAVEFGYVGKELGIIDQLRFLPLEETGDYTMSCVACSKTAQGKRIIERVNEVLLKMRPTERYRSFTERWLDKEIIPEYRKAYDDMFLSIRP